MVSILIAGGIFFESLFIVNLVPFWIPEMAWGLHFLFIAIFVEFFSGSLFPLDILPTYIQNILNLTPFPYLIFFPIQIYLGKVGPWLILKGIVISLVWVFILQGILNYVWKKGLTIYQAEGR